MLLPCRNAGGKEPTMQSYWLKRFMNNELC